VEESVRRIFLTGVFLFLVTGTYAADPAGNSFYNKISDEQARMDHQAIKKISAHEHYRVGGSMELYLETAGELGIEKAVFVPTGIGPDNRGYRKHMKALLEIQEKYPDRVVAFATVDEADPNAAAILEDAVKDGARGLKLIGGHPHFYDEPLDSPNMVKVYEVCRKYKLPILIHASLAKYPKQKKELEHVLRDFPDVTIVAAHYAKTSPHLEECQELLDRYPNLYIDISMGGGLPRYQKEMRPDPDKFRDFIIKNQDRIQWGTDIILSKTTTAEFLKRRISVDLNMFERAFYVYDATMPGQVLPGLNLPQPVLQKIYYDNPRKIFKI